MEFLFVTFVQTQAVKAPTGTDKNECRKYNGRNSGEGVIDMMFLRWASTNTKLVLAIAGTVVKITWNARVKAERPQRIRGGITNIALAKCCYKTRTERLSHFAHDTPKPCSSMPS